MERDDRQARVLAALGELEKDPGRRGFAADEIAAAADLDAADAEAVLAELAHTGQVEVVTAQWPDQGGPELPPGGRLYSLPDAERGGLRQ